MNTGSKPDKRMDGMPSCECVAAVRIELEFEESGMAHLAKYD
jgi:hypothetical protein